MTPAQEALCRVEAKRRVQRALDQIEAAQNMLNSAAATLSSLCYGNAECVSTGNMADRVKAHWYKVRNALQIGPRSSKVILDSLASENHLQRVVAAASTTEARPS